MHNRSQDFFRWLGYITPMLCALAGCGTTRWSDTSRTATEQMLISDAVDRAISQIDFSALSGHDVFLENKYIATYVDEKYIISTLRQHMLASGCVIKDKAEDASYVVEVRTGAVGTNRHDLLFGVPQTSLPVGGMFPLAPTSVPEIPLMKRTGQQGVCKIAVFAYDRLSGNPVWQSGTRQVASKAKDIWFFGAGPFQRGTIYEGTKFAGEKLNVPLAKQSSERPNDVWVSHEINFARPGRQPDGTQQRPAVAARGDAGPANASNAPPVPSASAQTATAPARQPSTPKSANVQASFDEPLWEPQMQLPGAPPALLPK